MTVFERIKKLASNQGKGVSKVATDLGFSENLFYRWKTSEPKARDLQKVADYFDVSVDYLLGRTENPSQIGETDEGFLRLNMSDLTPEEREEVEKDVDDIYQLALQKIKKRREMINRD